MGDPIGSCGDCFEPIYKNQDHWCEARAIVLPQPYWSPNVTQEAISTKGAGK
jgi:hypothetical protein